MYSASELRIPELVGVVDLTDYPGMGLDLSPAGSAEPGDYVVLSILRLGGRLYPIGYLRPYPAQMVAVEVDNLRVVGLDFNGGYNLPDFLSLLAEGEVSILSSYVIITGAGTTVHWFRRFPRVLASYVPCEELSKLVRSPLEYYLVGIGRSGSLFDFISQDSYGCFPLVEGMRVCLDHLRVNPGGPCVRI